MKRKRVQVDGAVASAGKSKTSDGKPRKNVGNGANAAPEASNILAVQPLVPESMSKPVLTGSQEHGKDVEPTKEETDDEGASAWTISKPMGGRIVDIDPILTSDDK